MVKGRIYPWMSQFKGTSAMLWHLHLPPEHLAPFVHTGTWTKSPCVPQTSPQQTQLPQTSSASLILLHELCMKHKQSTYDQPTAHDSMFASVAPCNGRTCWIWRPNWQPPPRSNVFLMWFQYQFWPQIAPFTPFWFKMHWVVFFCTLLDEQKRDFADLRPWFGKTNGQITAVELLEFWHSSCQMPVKLTLLFAVQTLSLFWLPGDPDPRRKQSTLPVLRRFETCGASHRSGPWDSF